jgi:hypothetical protein
MELKIVCQCGQKYAFDIEPVNGRMPQAVNCPVCGADGTGAGNRLLAEKFNYVPQEKPTTAPPMFPPKDRQGNK